MKTRNLIILLPLLLLFKPAKSQNFNSREVYKNVIQDLDLERIKETHYKLSYFNNNMDTLSRIGIIDRKITIEKYKSKDCFKIVEVNTSQEGREKTMAYIDKKTLLPVYVEVSKDGKLINTYIFRPGKVLIHSEEPGFKEEEEIEIPKEVFLSHNFSEILTANDFYRNKKIQFMTINPGQPANLFVAERIGEKKYKLPDGHGVDCWLIKFTVMTSQGKEIHAGYRYLDKTSGKVLAFKTALDSSSYFMYQVLFLD